ncbi:MerC family mercury resistance protein [Sphingorhabdus sp. Alg231-15]|uniref:MerC family mercury resistance protein n=1 Tax=Sphingorhabdus sp. Alg231-15 TaxID=1922222 RepID=UPI000D556C17
MQPAFYKDRAAIALSAACVVHCIALPVLAVSSPFLAVVAQAEWLHWTMVVMAVFASMSVLMSSPSARVPAFLVPAGFGGLFITGALFAEHFGMEDTLPTIIGGGLIASAHIYRIYK